MPEAPGELHVAAEAVLRTLASDAQTLVKSPRSTIVPPRDSERTRQALERLRSLARDPNALVEEATIGEGGMGIVRLATQVALNRTVAVKSLRPDRDSPESAEALLAEAWVTGALEHPNVVPVHDLTLDAKGMPVLVMKRIEGRTWATLLRDREAMEAHAPGRPPLEASLRILSQVCNVVHFAHSRGVVHRDLKPENVMVGSFGEVYVVDWGIATSAGPNSQLAGTPAYMAPEMLGTDGAALSDRTDVYLLGAVLHELVTGTPPHSAASARAMVESVIRSNPTLPDSVPPELATLVRACLQPRPEDRPASALAVRQAVEDYLEHQGSRDLAAQSDQRLAELLAMLQTATPDVTRVFNAFSECRFGYQQAVRSWPGNDQARAGLDRALQAMVRFELRRGAALAAQTLLEELTTREPALVHEVAAAVEREREQALQLDRLRELERNVDPRTGGTLRTVMAVTVAILWMFSPLIGHLVVPRWPQLETLSNAPLALASAVLVFVVGRRVGASRNVLNAQLGRTILLTMSVQAVGLVLIHLTFGSLGALTVVLNSAYWFVVAGIISVALLKDAWPIAVGYLCCALAAARWPELRYLCVAIANAILLVTVIAMGRRLRALAG